MDLGPSVSSASPLAQGWGGQVLGSQGPAPLLRSRCTEDLAADRQSIRRKASWAGPPMRTPPPSGLHLSLDQIRITERHFLSSASLLTPKVNPTPPQPGLTVMRVPPSKRGNHEILAFQGPETGLSTKCRKLLVGLTDYSLLSARHCAQGTGCLPTHPTSRERDPACPCRHS